MSSDPLTPEEPGSAAQRERRQRILDVTYDLASSGGFEAVQMRTVADRADVALGTLYRYFPSKIHLLVTALGRELERTDQVLRESPVPGGTPAERVIHVLHSTARGISGNQHLTEALTRAFMFADSSAKEEINRVGTLLTTMLGRAIHPGAPQLTEDDRAVARVIADVWLASLVAWVTGRSSARETAEHLERTVRLVLRD